MKHTLFVISLLVAALVSTEAVPRSRESFDFGWKFFRGEAAGADQAPFKDKAWRSVDLPHDWAIEREPGSPALFQKSYPQGSGCLPGGVGWYQPGLAVARGYRSGKLVAETRSETAGAAATLQLEPNRTNLAADGQDVAVINVRIADEKGRFVPAADNHVEFSLTGPGRIIGVGNGDPLSHESEKEPRRKAFNGLCQVLVQTTPIAGQIELTATSANLKPMSVKLQAQPRPAHPSVK